jgi:hypothetical protein
VELQELSKAKCLTKLSLAVGILKTFIRAERTGDWNLHLNTLAQMLSLFAATGHSNYAKCARLSLQRMLDLEKTHPALHKKFLE